MPFMRLVLLAGVAMAAFTANAAPASAAACLVSDVSLTIGSTTYAPTRCADAVANGNPTQETAALNTSLATTGFVFLAKSNDTIDPGALGGVTFAITAPATNSGTWSVAWSEAPGTPNLPLTMDIEVGLFGGSNGSGYLLTNVSFPSNPTTGSGTFDINFLNNGGQQPDLSHLTLTGGNVRPSTAVPEPASIALLGVGMIGTGLIARRRQAKTALTTC